MALIKCPECGHDLSDKAASCPNCGYPMPREQQAEAPAAEAVEPEPHSAEGGEGSKRWKMIALIAALAVGLIVAIVVNANGMKGQQSVSNATAVPTLVPVISGSPTPAPTARPTPTAAPKPTPTPRPTPTPAPTASPEPWVYVGMYKVGSDIEAGEYFLQVNSNSLPAYYEIASDSSGTLGSIIANDNVSSFCYLTVKEGDYIKLDRARMIKAEYVSPPTPSGKVADGMYKIGRDLPAGEYKVCAASDMLAYIEVAKDSRHILDSIISNDNFTGERYITVKDGQYLTISRGYIDLG